MRISKFVPMLTLSALTLASCGEQKKEREAVKYDINNLDTSIKPGDDFRLFATGGWAANNPMSDEYSRYGSFDQLRERNQEQIKGLIEELGQSEHKQGSTGQKIGDLYAIGMDSSKLNIDGAAPILADLEEIKNAKTQEDIVKLVGKIRQYASSPFFGFGVGGDQKNSDMNIVMIGQGGLGMGDRDYYLKDDSTSVALRAGYHRLIKTQFAQIDGALDAETTKIADAILKLETEIAKVHMSKEERRIPEKNYNKMKVSELNSKVASYNWDLFFKSAGVDVKFEDINVRQLEPIQKTVRLMNNTPIEDVKAYLSWCVINSAASYLSDGFANANFDFYGKEMSGRKEMQPRWKRVVNSVDGSLSEAVGQMYVEKYFPAEAKERMIELVKNLQVTLGERIQNLTWMGDETKAKAQEKLNTFHVKIGYPDKWIDYSSLEIKKDSYWANLVRASQFEYKEMLKDINQPVDKEKWLMPPQMVNAYYMPTTNEICFPAGILQAPFFYLDGDDAVNYGAIGVVIGHEMSHGFDDQGSKYDKDGNLVDWWTAEDKARFDERAKVLVDHFDAIEVLPGLHANGTFTLGENIGDFGGVQIAFNAFQKTQQAKEGKELEGYTPEQRFFLAYGGLWAGHIREAEVRRLTQIDPHSLGEWRINGMLPHIDAWYKAFDVKEGDKLYLPKEKRADIW